MLSDHYDVDGIQNRLLDEKSENNSYPDFSDWWNSLLLWFIYLLLLFMLPPISVIFDIWFASCDFWMALEFLMMIQPIQCFMMDSSLICLCNYTKRSKQNVDIWYIIWIPKLCSLLIQKNWIVWTLFLGCFIAFFQAGQFLWDYL